MRTQYWARTVKAYESLLLFNNVLLVETWFRGGSDSEELGLLDSLRRLKIDTPGLYNSAEGCLLIYDFSRIGILKSFHPALS
jgi:hypothetical protein